MSEVQLYMQEQKTVVFGSLVSVSQVGFLLILSPKINQRGSTAVQDLRRRGMLFLVCFCESASPHYTPHRPPAVRVSHHRPSLFLLSLSLSHAGHGAAMAAPRTMRAMQYDKYGDGAEGLKVHARRHNELSPNRLDMRRVRFNDRKVRFRRCRDPCDVWLGELLAFLLE